MIKPTRASTRVACAARVACVALLTACVASLPLGCATDPRDGYSTTPTYPAGVATVAVPIFRNTTPTPGLEQMLTEAVIKQIQSTTPMRVVQDSARGSQADSTLTARITKAELRRLSVETSTGLVQEVAVLITVDFAWRDARTGKTLVERKNFTASDSFVPSRPTGERIELGQRGATQRLAQDIVHELRGAW
jgi:hypothetical protein